MRLLKIIKIYISLNIFFIYVINGYAFNITSFSNTTYNENIGVMNTELGIQGYIIEDFEDVYLVKDLTIERKNPDHGPSKELFQLYDPSHLFQNNTWDGQYSFTNAYDNGWNSVTTTNCSQKYAQVTTFIINYGANSFGIGLANFQVNNSKTYLLINGEKICTIDELPAYKDGINIRNLYLKIDVENNEVIESVSFQIESPCEALVFDHLAFSSGTVKRKLLDSIELESLETWNYICFGGSSCNLSVTAGNPEVNHYEEQIGYQDSNSIKGVCIGRTLMSCPRKGLTKVYNLDDPAYSDHSYLEVYYEIESDLTTYNGNYIGVSLLNDNNEILGKKVFYHPGAIGRYLLNNDDSWKSTAIIMEETPKKNIYIFNLYKIGSNIKFSKIEISLISYACIGTHSFVFDELIFYQNILGDFFVRDSDSDGVIDIFDHCLNTPLAAAIYSNGCKAEDLYTQIHEYEQTITLISNRNRLLTEAVLENTQIIQELKQNIENKSQTILSIENDLFQSNQTIEDLNKKIQTMYSQKDVDDIVEAIIKNKYTGYRIMLNPGWHLISAIHVNAAPKTIPENAIEEIYRFNKGTYLSVTELAPGHGYWVKINQPCEFIVEALSE